jgi:uncharacterized protein (TIGR00369 family)
MDRMERPTGLVSPADIAGLSGLEILRAMAEGRLPQAPMARRLEAWLCEVAEGFAAFEGEPTTDVLNPMGTVHGGWALALIDSACACAAQTLLPTGVGFATLETHASFVRPILPGMGRCRTEARTLSQGRSVITAQANVLGPDGTLLAHGTSTIMIRPSAMPTGERAA